jgi:hypothetical protein
MRVFGLRLIGGLAFVTLLMPTLGMAETAPPAASQLTPASVCTNGLLDRTRLLAAAAASSNIDPTEAEALLRADIALQATPKSLSAFKVISAKYLQYENFSSLVQGTIATIGGPAALDESDAFLIGTSPPQIKCAPAASDHGEAVTNGAKANRPPGAVPAGAIRVRGLADDLIYSASSSQFESSSKASFSLGGTGTTHTQTAQAKAAIGYAFDAGQFASIIPYAATNYSFSKANGSARKPSSETYDVGVLGAWETPSFQFQGPLGPKFGHFILSGAPDYLANDVDGSRLADLTFVVAPYLPGMLNNWINVSGLACGDLNRCNWLSVEPLLDLRGYGGDYVDKGDPVKGAAPNTNYLRLGSRMGAAFHVTDLLDLSATEDLLYGTIGARRVLTYFQSSATLNVTSDKRVGLTASYTNG